MTEHITVDARDLAILRELQADGRLTNQALSDKVGLSASATLARTKRLEKAGVITGYGAHIDRGKLGPSVTVFAEVTLKRHHPEDFTRFDQVLAETPEVVEAAQVSGAYDYLIRVVTRDVPAWNDLVDRLTEADAGADKIVSRVMMKAAKPFAGYEVR